MRENALLVRSVRGRSVFVFDLALFPRAKPHSESECPRRPSLMQSILRSRIPNPARALSSARARTWEP
eukprot:2613225-Rhodomonas_salina.1